MRSSLLCLYLQRDLQKPFSPDWLSELNFQIAIPDTATATAAAADTAAIIIFFFIHLNALPFVFM